MAEKATVKVGQTWQFKHGNTGRVLGVSGEFMSYSTHDPDGMHLSTYCQIRVFDFLRDAREYGWAEADGAPQPSSATEPRVEVGQQYAVNVGDHKTRVILSVDGDTVVTQLCRRGAAIQEPLVGRLVDFIQDIRGGRYKLLPSFATIDGDQGGSYSAEVAPPNYPPNWGRPDSRPTVQPRCGQTWRLHDDPAAIPCWQPENAGIKVTLVDISTDNPQNQVFLLPPVRRRNDAPDGERAATTRRLHLRPHATRDAPRSLRARGAAGGCRRAGGPVRGAVAGDVGECVLWGARADEGMQTQEHARAGQEPRGRPSSDCVAEDRARRQVANVAWRCEQGGLGVNIQVSTYYGEMVLLSLARGDNEAIVAVRELREGKPHLAQTAFNLRGLKSIRDALDMIIEELERDASKAVR